MAANWVETLFELNPELIVKEIRSRGERHIAFRDGNKTIWHFACGDEQGVVGQVGRLQLFGSVGADYLGSTNDGHIRALSASYATARSTSGLFNTIDDNFRVGQAYDGNYYIWRAFLRFDTSAIPDSDIVTQVNLKMMCVYDYSVDDFDVQIVKQDWSAQDPLSDANREAAYDGCLAGAADDNIWRNTLGMSSAVMYASGNLNTAWINKIGNTYYSLRSNKDYGNTAPVGNEMIGIASQNNAVVANRPLLTVITEAPVVAQHLLVLGIG